MCLSTVYKNEVNDANLLAKNVADIKMENGQIIFLHKIVPGSASKSYGVHVARLAGVPSDLLENAEAKLEKLEQEEAIDSVRDAFGSAGNVAEQNSVETNRDRGGFDGGAEAVSDGSQLLWPFGESLSFVCYSDHTYRWKRF